MLRNLPHQAWSELRSRIRGGAPVPRSAQEQHRLRVLLVRPGPAVCPLPWSKGVRGGRLGMGVLHGCRVAP